MQCNAMTRPGMLSMHIDKVDPSGEGKALEQHVSDPSAPSTLGSTSPSLRAFEPGAHFASMLWDAIDPLERLGLHAYCLPLLRQLLASPYQPHRRGRWW